MVGYNARARPYVVARIVRWMTLVTGILPKKGGASRFVPRADMIGPLSAVVKSNRCRLRPVDAAGALSPTAP
jgi:hypothetical protein